ncbi:hypothetical protein JB92DRAFT_3102547 [Gautieria morchelliformis]|nr:hypothetical protein JB92DRAFT_3102547 [Gautieria morchelliformis]
MHSRSSRCGGGTARPVGGGVAGAPGAAVTSARGAHPAAVRACITRDAAQRQARSGAHQNALGGARPRSRSVGMWPVWCATVRDVRLLSVWCLCTLHPPSHKYGAQVRNPTSTYGVDAQSTASQYGPNSPQRVPPTGPGFSPAEPEPSSWAGLQFCITAAFTRSSNTAGSFHTMSLPASAPFIRANIIKTSCFRVDQVNIKMVHLDDKLVLSPADMAGIECHALSAHLCRMGALVD